MSQSVAELQAAYNAARSALLNELERDCERRDGSAAQERRREEYQDRLREEEQRCLLALQRAQELEKAASIPEPLIVSGERVAQTLRYTQREIEALRTMGGAAAVVHRCEINARLAVLQSLGVLDEAESQKLHLQADEAEKK